MKWHTLSSGKIMNYVIQITIFYIEKKTTYYVKCCFVNFSHGGATVQDKKISVFILFLIKSYTYFYSFLNLVSALQNKTLQKNVVINQYRYNI